MCGTDGEGQEEEKDNTETLLDHQEERHVGRNRVHRMFCFSLLFEIQVGKELYSRTNSAVEQESWTSHGSDMIHTGNDALVSSKENRTGASIF